MNNITIKVVETRKEQDDFIQLPNRLYADNPCYVPDLDMDVRAMLKGVLAFVAYNAEGTCVGRITAFINPEANAKWGLRAVRFSHIDFIDDINVARALLNAAEDWGRQQGMDTAMGPLGYYDFDKEGMLVEGFDRLSSIVEFYNAPYYPKYLEELGYTKDADWVQTRFAIPVEPPKSFSRVAKYVKEELHMKVRKLTRYQLMTSDYGRRVFELFNETYSHLFGFSSMPPEQIDKYLSQYLPLLDPDLVPFIEDKDGNLIGACVAMGSLNHAMQKSKGRLLPFGWWHLLRALLWKHEDTVSLLLIGVKPEYQGYGVNSLFFDDLIPILQRKGYKWAETGPQLEDNSRVQSQWKALNPEIVKRRRCYCKHL